MTESLAAQTLDEEGLGALPPAVVLSDKYRVDRVLGRGGLGVVVAASHVELQHSVAIKYLQPHARSNPTLVTRFKREAQLAVSFRSENIVRVFDVGSDPQCGPYIVMEYLEGEDLGAMIDRGRVPVRDAIDWVLQACKGIAEAHARGVVHRDLKPDNLFLARRENDRPVVKVLDFGISKPGRAETSEARLARLTKPTDAFGTPLYMSPEQRSAPGEVDARSDVWALGVVLFELVTGERPFDDDVSVLGPKTVDDPTKTLQRLCPDAPAGLDRIIATCLAEDPAARYASASELSAALAQIMADTSTARDDLGPEWLPCAVDHRARVRAAHGQRVYRRAIGVAAIVFLVAFTTSILRMRTSGANENPLVSPPVVVPESLLEPISPTTRPSASAAASGDACPAPSATPKRASVAPPMLSSPHSRLNDYNEFGDRR